MAFFLWLSEQNWLTPFFILVILAAMILAFLLYLVRIKGAFNDCLADKIKSANDKFKLYEMYGQKLLGFARRRYGKQIWGWQAFRRSIQHALIYSLILLVLGSAFGETIQIQDQDLFGKNWWVSIYILLSALLVSIYFASLLNVLSENSLGSARELVQLSDKKVEKLWELARRKAEGQSFFSSPRIWLSAKSWRTVLSLSGIWMPFFALLACVFISFLEVCFISLFIEYRFLSEVIVVVTIMVVGLVPTFSSMRLDRLFLSVLKSSSMVIIRKFQEKKISDETAEMEPDSLSSGKRESAKQYYLDKNKNRELLESEVIHSLDELINIGSGVLWNSKNYERRRSIGAEIGKMMDGVPKSDVSSDYGVMRKKQPKNMNKSLSPSNWLSKYSYIYYYLIDRTLMGVLFLAPLLISHLLFDPFYDWMPAYFILIFWVIVPFVNGIIDYFSVGFTRGLIKSLISGEKSGLRRLKFLKPYLIIFGDITIAFIFLFLIVSVLPFLISAANIFGHSVLGVSGINIDNLITRTVSNPLTDGFWVTAMFVTTLIPTLLHLPFAIISPLVLSLSTERRNYVIERLAKKDKSIISWALCYLVWFSFGGAISTMGLFFIFADLPSILKWTYDFFAHSQPEYLEPLELMEIIARSSADLADQTFN